MTFEEALATFAAPGDAVPAPAIGDVLAQWDTMGPRCLALLDGYVHGRDLSEQTEQALFFVVHLLGEKSETAAFPLLCALAGDMERADLVLGDAITATLPGILINTFDGDAVPLRALAGQPDGDVGVRDTALLTLAYLTRAGRLPAAEMHEFCTTLFATMPPQPRDPIWASLVTAVALLGFADLTPQAEAAFAGRCIDPQYMTFRDFRVDLQRAIQSPGSLRELESHGIKPLGRATEALAAWDFSGEDEEPQEPYVNPLRDIGRNDPCPCGSGKKYKKCCLV